MNTQFKKGLLDLCVLSLISQRDRYGYELVAEISQEFEISEGTLYPILRRLTEEKLFETYLQESKEGPARKYYRITSAGRKHHGQLKAEWNKFYSRIHKMIEGKDERSKKSERLLEAT